MPRFRARELRQGISPDELRREFNEAQREVAAEFALLSGRRRVTELQIAGPFSARYGDVVRVSPPTAGLRVVLPPVNLEQPDARVTVVVEGSSGALTVEAVDATVNGGSTLAFAAGIGTAEFQLTPAGWFGWSASLVLSLPLTALAEQDPNTVVANDRSVSAPPSAVAVDADSVLARVGGDLVSHPWSTLAGGGLDYAAGVISAAIAPGSLFADNNFGVPFLIRNVFAAGAAGTADDVTIYNGNAPFAFRIVDCWVQVATAIVATTVQLRTASGGGGTALSSALSTALTGTVSNNDTASRSVASAGSVFLRRSDRGVAGTILILALRE